MYIFIDKLFEDEGSHNRKNICKCLKSEQKDKSASKVSKSHSHKARLFFSLLRFFFIPAFFKSLHDSFSLELLIHVEEMLARKVPSSGALAKNMDREHLENNSTE